MIKCTHGIKCAIIKKVPGASINCQYKNGARIWKVSFSVKTSCIQVTILEVPSNKLFM